MVRKKKVFATVALSSSSQDRRVISIAKQCLEVLSSQGMKVLLDESLSLLKSNENRISKEKYIMSNSDLLVAIGGDGTMHEIINGMLSREDRKQIPIGLIPSGTGNSFMHDLDSLNPTIAAKKINQLQTRKIDLMKIKTESETIFSFNVAGWGMPPDINILAEKMRWLGLQRYNIASLIEIMRFKKRQCDLIINNENIL